MTLSRRPSRRQDERNDAFVKQAAAVEVQGLDCQIPADLHRRVWLMAAERNIKMTAVVSEALRLIFPTAMG